MRALNIIAAIAVIGGSSLVTRAESPANASPETAQPAPAASSPSTAAMLERVHALEGRINQLQDQQSKTQADVTAAINDMLATADRNSKLMAVSPTGLASGYDPNTGFVLQSGDGNFLMHPGVLFQFRNMTSYRAGIPAGGGGETAKTGDDTQNGFVVSRLRLTLDGNVINPNLTYFFQVADDNGSGGLTLYDAYFMERISNQSPLALKFGQFKDPVWHESNLLPGNQLAVDRSLLNSFLGSGQDFRVQGVGLIYDEEQFRGQVVVHDGFNSQNTKFFDAGGVGAGFGGGAGVTPTNWGISVRAEQMVIGERTPAYNPYAEYDQFTAMGDKKDILVVGGGADFSQAGANDVILHTIDAQYNLASGWAFYGAYLGSYRDLQSNKGVAPGHYYDSGLLAQAAYMVTPQLEPFARWDYTHLDGQALVGVNKDNVHEITIGANYYFQGQHAKVTIDGSWLPNGSPTDVDMLGVLKNDGHNEFTIRAQFQLEI
jgi:hypothetical protein